MATLEVTETEDTDATIVARGPSKLRKKHQETRLAAVGEDAEPEAPPAPTEERVEDEDVDTDKDVKRSRDVETKAFSELRAAENSSVTDWIKSFAVGGAPLKVQVLRKDPTSVIDPATGQRVNVSGLLETFEREITEEEIADKYGGGNYQAIIRVKNAKGKYQYQNARTFQIAGEPLLANLPRTAPPSKEPTVIHAPEAKTDPLAIKAFDMLSEQVRNQQRAPAGPTQADQMAMVNLMMEPMRAQNAALVKTIENLQTDLREARKGDPTETSFSSRMMDKLIDQDTARLTAQRNQFESEIRQLKENAREDEKRLRDSFERDKQYLLNSHERELAAVRASYDQQIATLKDMNALSIKTLESENRRLEKDLTKLELEVTKLRDKKEPSLKDKIDEINAFKDLVGGDEAEQSTVGKIIEGVANSPLGAGLAGLAERALSSGGQAQQQPAAQVVPQQPSARVNKLRMIRDKRTNQVYATDGTRTVPVQRIQPAAQVNPETGEVVPPAPPEAPIPYIDPDTVKIATTFMLNGLQNDIDPATFAESARAHVPKEIVGALNTMNLDDFLSKVAQLDATSPLRTQRGRNWLRKVHKHLMGETE